MPQVSLSAPGQDFRVTQADPRKSFPRFNMCVLGPAVRDICLSSQECVLYGFASVPIALISRLSISPSLLSPGSRQASDQLVDYKLYIHFM